MFLPGLEETMNEREKYVFGNICARRSIRRYVEGRPVEKEKITRLLEAAMAAPSACNIQPWEFIVCTDKTVIDKIKAVVFPGNGDYNTPLIMIVCGNPKFIPWENDVGTIDCAAAIQNMLLAAEAMDLGSVWIGAFKNEDIRGLLGIPDNIHPVGMVYFGYPAYNPEPRTQYVEQAIHWEKYDADRIQEKRKGCIV